MSIQQILDALPEEQRKHLDPATPKGMRMMAAKGIAPLAPRDLVLITCGLTLDKDQELSSAAQASLGMLKEKVLPSVLGDALPPVTFEILFGVIADNESLLQMVALNGHAPDDIVTRIASVAPAPIVEILVQNQERCLRSKPLVDALRKNPALSKVYADALFDFLARAGVIHDDMPEFAEALTRLSPAERDTAVSAVELPAELASMLDPSATANTKLAPASEQAAAAEDAASLDLNDLILEQIPSDEVSKDGEQDEAETSTDDEETEDKEEQKRIPMLKLIASLNIAQKVALAIKGNKEARSILIRDTNRVVCTAAIRSPRITEQEIAKAAQSTSMDDDVIRIIAKSKDMTRSYSVKLALAKNPKTPHSIAIHLMGLLRQNDLRQIAKSKNVSSAVAAHAKKIVLMKSGGKKKD